jgi:hypothetical protein
MCWKRLPRTNTLAYWKHFKIATLKSFEGEAAGFIFLLQLPLKKMGSKWCYDIKLNDT